MKTIRLLTLEMENIKNCPHRVVEFGGGDKRITGENGSGKTTHYDAVSWVLFGKDSLGRLPGEKNSDFNIKPNDSLGSGRMPMAQVTLSVDGVPVVLKKVYREIWTKPRGCAEQKYSGNTTDCFIDGVPKKEKDYKDYVNAIVTEEQWRLLTDVYYFCRDMPWKERRALLFDLCGVGDDAAMLAENPEFAPLAKEIGNLTLEDCKARLRSERLRVNKLLDAYPIRMDECAKTADSLRGIDFAKAREALAQKQAEYDAVQGQIADIVHNTALDKAIVRRNAAENSRTALINENLAHQRAQETPYTDPRPALREKLEETEKSLAQKEAEFESAKAFIGQAEMRLAGYRSRWKEIQQEPWKGDKVCPQCGQALPAHKIADAKAAFAANKTARQKALEQDSELLKKDMKEKQEAMGRLDAEIAETRLKKEELAGRLESIPEPELPEIHDLPGYGQNLQKLIEEIAAADAEIHRLRRKDRALEDSLREQAAGLSAELGRLRTECAKESILLGTQARMAQYEEERRTEGAELSRLDGLLYLADSFLRYKSGRITDAVNALFENVRFRLFTEQVNGGMAECCDAALPDGTPYGTASDGEKAKIGLEVIRALMKALGMSLPVFIDKAGEITGIPDLGTQTIIMKAQEGQKELKYE